MGVRNRVGAGGRRRLAGLVMVLVAGVVGACGKPEAGAPLLTTVMPTPITDRPSTTASPPRAECPASGLLVSAGMVEAGLGHRGVALSLVNCGTRSYPVNGYPEIGVLDAFQNPIAVVVKRGSSYFAQDRGPKRLTLAPGERVRAVLAWSATVTDGDPVVGTYAVVIPLPGVPPQTLPLETDLGTTDELDVTAWRVELPE